MCLLVVILVLAGIAAELLVCPPDFNLFPALQTGMPGIELDSGFHMASCYERESGFPGVGFPLDLLMRIDSRQKIEGSVNSRGNIGACRIKGIFWPVYRETELVVLYTDFHGFTIKRLYNKKQHRTNY